MLLLALIVLTAGVHVEAFNVTSLVVPELVPASQDVVELECRYEGDFTFVSWFKGSNEFFRYTPGGTPAINNFPMLGLGKVEMIYCGPTACRLRLSDLTQDATGLYKCDIQRDVPPYKFKRLKAYMEVRGHEKPGPQLEGVAEELDEGDELKAYCHGSPGTEIRWFVNSYEMANIRGSPFMNKTTTKLSFLGSPPAVTVQCAEFRDGKLTGSNKMSALLKSSAYSMEDAQEQRTETSKAIKTFDFNYFVIMYCVIMLLKSLPRIVPLYP